MKADHHLEDLDHIRTIMERSTTFMSLTGLSGVLAGVYGLIAWYLASWKLGTNWLDTGTVQLLATDRDLQRWLLLLALATLAVTLLTAAILTVYKGRGRGQAVWDSVARKFLLHLFVPLAAGGLFTVALVAHGQFQLVCPALLLFFGLALLSVARFVQMDAFWLGSTELILGVLAAFRPEYGLLLWAAGFGVATLLYGVLMYHKYER